MINMKSNHDNMSDLLIVGSRHEWTCNQYLFSCIVSCQIAILSHRLLCESSQYRGLAHNANISIRVITRKHAIYFRQNFSLKRKSI